MEKNIKRYGREPGTPLGRGSLFRLNLKPIFIFFQVKRKTRLSDLRYYYYRYFLYFSDTRSHDQQLGRLSQGLPLNQLDLLVCLSSMSLLIYCFLSLNVLGTK